MISSAPILTKRGENLLMRAIAGEAITFTKFKVGSGSIPGGTNPENLLDLITPLITFSVTSIDDTEAGMVAVTGEFTSADVVNDFVWRELGLFAKGEDNREILYAYANDGDDAGTIPAIDPDEHIITYQRVTMIIAVGDASNVTAVFSEDSPYVVGTYVGDGTTKLGINLGFVPSAVMLFNEWGQTYDSTDGVCGGLATGSYGIRSKASQDPDDAVEWDNQYTALLCGRDTENDFAGFWVNYYSGQSADENISTNVDDVRYHYIAYR